MRNSTRQNAEHVPQTNNIEEMREIFSLVDKDGGGTISTEELGELLEIIGIEATEDDLGKMVEQMDSDNSGEIDFEEFAEVMMRRVKCGYSCDEIENAFGLIQLDSGSEKSKLHTEDIVKFLTMYGTQNPANGFTEERVRYLVSLLESDQDNYVDYQEYVEMMMNW
jgi:calmodulin